MYTVETFKAEVAKHGGYESLLAMYFNNSNVVTFGTGKVFDPATNLDESTATVVIEAEDIQGHVFVTTRKLEYLEGMTFAKVQAERDKIDLRAVRY